MANSAKAQTAIEYFIIVALALMIIIPYIIYSNELLIGYKEENTITLSKNAVSKIGQNADWVFSQGEPAKISTEVYIPSGVEQVQFLNNTIVFKVRTSAGVSDIFYIAATNITGSLPTSSGYYIVYLSALNNSVNVTV